MTRACVAALVALCSAAAFAASPEEIIAHYAEQARQEDPDFAGFSVERGKEVYFRKGVIRGVGEVSCARCHRPDPRELIIAHETDILCRACHVIHDEEHPAPNGAKKRKIEPLAPSHGHNRLTDPDTVDVFLRLNCKLTFKRDCTTLEKGDVLTWILSIH
ncbi:MAG: DUF1924 domain-containing protein [Burkholderiales bacterium]